MSNPVTPDTPTPLDEKALEHAVREFDRADTALFGTPAPPAEPTSEAVAWTDTQVDAAVEAWFSGMDIDLRPASREDFRMRMRKALATLAHPLPSDAPSGWDTDVRLVLTEVATWITLAHHRDGCRQRYGEACTCGRDSILAKLKFPASPPQDAPRRAEVEAAVDRFAQAVRASRGFIGHPDSAKDRATNYALEEHLSQARAALLSLLADPAATGHAHRWSTFGPGGPLQTALTVCLDCGKLKRAGVPDVEEAPAAPVDLSAVEDKRQALHDAIASVVGHYGSAHIYKAVDSLLESLSQGEG